jgi:DNA processing protein
VTGPRLTEAQRLDWLRLIRSENVGPRTFRALVNQFGGAGAALDALPDLARRGGRPALKVASRAEAEREMEGLSRLGARLLALGELDYPKALQAIEGAPPLVAVRGDPAILRRPAVAIVGSRNASAAGLTFTERLGRSLGQAGLVIVSGLARGIDTRAHKAALQTGTIAVLAGGLDRIYPPDNEGLLARIVDEGGAALSEMPLGWEARGRDFPRRNRLVSGLSYGVVVVEAARRSGSLITARYALEQGREVLAVPGSPLDPRAEGTNDLIRDGATLCAAPEHVLAAVEPSIASSTPFAPQARRGGLGDAAWDRTWGEDEGDAPGAETAAEPDAVGSEVAVLLGPAPVSIDDLARQSGLPIRVVRLALLELELAGRLERHGGHAVSLLTD